MKYLKSAKRYAPEAVFVLLIAVFWYTYFVVYRTPSRDNWYAEMLRQFIDFFHKLVT